jgi:hypothetical protein
LKGIRRGLERVFPPKGGCNPVVGLQCAARIGGKQRKGTKHLLEFTLKIYIKCLVAKSLKLVNCFINYGELIDKKNLIYRVVQKKFMM